MSTARDTAYIWLVAQLRSSRLQHNWSQKELASKLGKPQSYVSKYETGERRIDFIETIRISRALELDFTALVPPDF
jgi:transcriptional regulator with XRE-family HTH domain